MAMTGFICHDDYYDRLKRLSNEEVGNLFRQLMLYHAGRYEEMTDFIDSEGIAFDFIANDIDRMEEKHNAISETNRANGSKGGRPKKQTEPDESEETEKNRQEPDETEQKPTKAYKDKDKDKNKNTSPFFERFWDAYPRHINKQGAMKAFEKAKIDADLLQVILTAIENQKSCEQWTKDNGQFIPHPATWLNGHRWEDEVVIASPKADVNAQQYTQRDYDDEQAEAMQRMLRGMGA